MGLFGARAKCNFCGKSVSAKKLVDGMCTACRDNTEQCIKCGQIALKDKVVDGVCLRCVEVTAIIREVEEGIIAETGAPANIDIDAALKLPHEELKPYITGIYEKALAKSLIKEEPVESESSIFSRLMRELPPLDEIAKYEFIKRVRFFTQTPETCCDACKSKLGAIRSTTEALAAVDEGSSFHPECGVWVPLRERSSSSWKSEET